MLAEPDLFALEGNRLIDAVDVIVTHRFEFSGTPMQTKLRKIRNAIPDLSARYSGLAAGVLQGLP